MKKSILAILLLAALVLSGCNSTEPSVAPETSVPAESQEPAPAEIMLNAPDATYTIIRPDLCDEAVTLIAADLCKELRDLAGETKIRIETDWVKNEADAQNDNYEILIGATNRAESAAALAAIKTYHDYIIAVDGNKICITANTIERLDDAVEHFTAQIKAENGSLIYGTASTFHGQYNDYLLPELTIGGASIADFSLILSEGASAAEQKLAADLQTFIRDNQGSVLPILTDKTPVGEKEILIGRTNRPESTAAVEGESVRYMTVGTKLVILAGGSAYYSAAKNQVLEHLEAEEGSVKAGLDVTVTFTGMEYFLQNNYAADHIATLKEELNPGVLALLSCCEYYNDSMIADSAKGNKWIYSSNAKYVTQVCRFDDMLYKFTAKGGNCAAPTNWAFIDMEIMPDTYRFWGDSDGSFARRTKVEPYVGAACEIYDLTAEGKTFMELYRAGRVKTGDIFLGKGHTFIYRGGESFYAAGHDSDWHTDSTVVSEDKRKAVFENWVLSFAECPSNCKYGVTFQIRIKDEYVPKYFRNQAGELVSNPMYVEKAG